MAPHRAESDLDQIGRARCVSGRDQKYIQNSYREAWEEKTTGYTLAYDGRHLLEFDFLYWIYLAVDRDKRRAFVNVLINLRAY
jgi:hypothetical protein